MRPDNDASSDMRGGASVFRAAASDDFFVVVCDGESAFMNTTPAWAPSDSRIASRLEFGKSCPALAGLRSFRGSARA